MTWKWDQSAGKMYHDGAFVSDGYAGAGAAKNNPTMQNAQGLGPIPRGMWKMIDMRTSPNTGPLTIVLDPMPGTDTLSRSAFRIHGDSIAHPGEASHGCIILPRPVRQRIWDSGDHALEVVE